MICTETISIYDYQKIKNILSNWKSNYGIMLRFNQSVIYKIYDKLKLGWKIEAQDSVSTCVIQF